MDSEIEMCAGIQALPLARLPCDLRWVTVPLSLGCFNYTRAAMVELLALQEMKHCFSSYESSL